MMIHLDVKQLKLLHPLLLISLLFSLSLFGCVSDTSSSDGVSSASESGADATPASEEDNGMIPVGNDPIPNVRSFSLDEACAPGNQWRYLKRGDECWRIGMDCSRISDKYEPSNNTATATGDIFYRYKPGRSYLSIPDEKLYSPDEPYGSYEDMIYDPIVSPGDELICTYTGDENIEEDIQSYLSDSEIYVRDLQELEEQGKLDATRIPDANRLMTYPRAEYFKVTGYGYYTDGYAGSTPSLTHFDADVLSAAGIQTVDFNASAPYYLCDTKFATISNESGTEETVEFVMEYVKTPNVCHTYAEETYVDGRYFSTRIPDLEPGEYIVSLSFDIPGDDNMFKITVN